MLKIQDFKIQKTYGKYGRFKSKRDHIWLCLEELYTGTLKVPLIIFLNNTLNIKFKKYF